MYKTWDLVELVRAAQGGDRGAFGELARRYEPCVAATARRCRRDAHEAEELCQDVFLTAMRKVAQLREPRHFAAWLKRITVRLAINRSQRQRGFATAEEPVLEGKGDDSANPLESLLREEGRQRVRTAVAALGAIDRQALSAFYLRGRSLQQIAEEYGVPLGTVKRRLHTARQRLQQSLSAAECPVRTAVRPVGRPLAAAS